MRKNTSTSVVVNESLIKKLDSIVDDIKCYININSDIGEGIDEEEEEYYAFIDEGEMRELVDIRVRLKILSRQLDNKMLFSRDDKKDSVIRDSE